MLFDASVIFEWISTIFIWGIVTFPIWGFILGVIGLFTDYTAEELNAEIDERTRILQSKLLWWKAQPRGYNNPSNITDDAFLLFIGEQKLVFGHPESTKSIGEEW